MKNTSLALLFCCAVLSACDKSSDTASKTEAEAPQQAGASADDTSSVIEDVTNAAAIELDNAIASAKEAANSLTDSAKESAGDAVDTITDVSSDAVEKSSAMIASITQDDVQRGESIYNSSCIACHGAGVAGAPKLGDQVAWEPRIAQGDDVLIRHAIEGFNGMTGVMPPKGGNMSLADEDVSLAVSYMMSQAQ
jgi:cytochrome c5